MWGVMLSCAGVILVGVIYGLVRLVRVMLPDTSADRLSWWMHYWEHRRELRQGRWKHQDELRAQRQPSGFREVGGIMASKDHPS
jgi:hypothetical protein